MATTYLKRTNGTPTNAQKGTFSAWVKRSKIGGAQRILMNFLDGNNYSYLRMHSDNYIQHYGYLSGSAVSHFKASRLLRDTSAWYHIMLVVDTTQGTASDRVKIYVNGEQLTSFSQADYPNQNITYPMFIASGSNYHTVGSAENGTDCWDGVMSHVHFSDGYALAPTVFGETDSTTGEWKIKTSPSFTLGNNGYTILKDGNTITDQSSNSNNFTLGGGTLTKTEDCPSNVFATLNNLTKTGNDIKTVGNGNTSVSASSSSAWASLYSNLGASTGKFYCEVKITDTYGPDANNFVLGIQDVTTFNQSSNEKIATNSTGFAYRGNGNKVTNNSQTSYANTYTTGNIIGVAMDLDNSKLYYSKDGVWQNSGVPTSGSTGTGSAFNLVSGTTYVFGMASYYTQDDYQFNFGNGYFGTTAVSSAGTNASGNGIFEYDVPTGYTALSTKGLNL